ncbi:DUF4097 family beta strand repeat-containing protein [Anaerococcus sp.]|uniref:DUF4097 family beta strand repeat-containing protein n=1 Tax=Anaerococcus TaxID=165779 RepID=UPI002904D100|nr:DUF4097 family beta strand repeat-containing protein [Anaerococcus sp.]MDU1827904.1 DUF4097 family beta strand repeat-containing protein [Anaerococcus sp.]MDU1863762.1 DUF4097 family beta strand repeat-containing protein [Anaerococcus sp.]
MEDNRNNEVNDNVEEYDEEIEEILSETNNKSRRKLKLPKYDKKIKIIIGIIIVVALAALLYFLNKNKNSNVGESKTSQVVDEDSYNGSNIMRVDLNQVKKINIDLKTADVRIQRSNTNPYIEYTHLYKGEDDIYTVDVSYENGELNLKSNIQGKELNMKNKVQIVRIFLPKDEPLDEIKANIGAGNVKITDLEVKDLDLNVKSGHVTFDNSFFGGSVSNEAGDIILDNSELLNSKLTTNSGDIVISDSKLGQKSDFSTSTGNIVINSKDKIDSFNIDARLEVGNFILGNISYRNIKDGFSKDNKAKKDVSLETKVGDIIFNKGEGAILEEEEYITNKSKRDDSDSKHENEEESQQEVEQKIQSEAEKTLNEDIEEELEESGQADYSINNKEEKTNN